MPRLPNQLVSPLLMKTARNRIHEVTISPKTKNNTIKTDENGYLC